jgi:PAS domain S-box-containing protein
MKLNTKIVVLVLEIGLIPVLLLGFVGYSNTKQQIIKNTFTKLDAIAQIQKNRVEEILQNRSDSFTSNDINDVVNDYTGLGDTGETLLAKNDGHGNALFITPIRFDAKAAFVRTVPKERTDIPSIHAINGEEGIFDNLVDYRNIPVFSATRYISEVGWGIVVKIDQAEAMAPVQKLGELSVFLAILSGIFIVLIGAVISRSITDPIYKLIAVADKIAEGDLSQRIKVATHDEIGSLGQAFNTMATKLKEFYATLEEKVRLRTQDLEKANIAAQNVLEDLNIEKIKTGNLVNDLKKFKLAMDNTFEQVVITDSEGTVIYANQAVEKITGYKPEEALGKKSGVLWKTPMLQEYYQKMWNIIKNQKKVFIGEIQNKRKNGEIYVAAISISPILDKNGEVEFFVSIERDITKEKEIDKAKTEFVSLASHQLRTPLTAINWYVEMLQSGDAGKLNKTQGKYLEEIYQGSGRMIKLVNDLLNISRIETGRLKVEPEPTDLVSFISDIVQEIWPWSATLHREVVFEKPEGLPKIAIDKTLIRQVVHNMITNAVRYSPASKNPVKVELEKKDDGYVISVLDEGIGIPKEAQGKIFGKFFRADNAREVEGEGSGIGLYICKSIVDMTGGKIWFKSPTAFKKVDGVEIGYGTTFYLSVPVFGMKKHEGEKELA